VVKSEAEARAVLGQVAAGAPFDRLAMERSIDAATRFNGGDLDYFTPDIMPEPMRWRCRAPRPAASWGRSARRRVGWCCASRTAVPNRPTPWTRSARRLVRFLTFDRIRQLLEELRGKAEINVLLENPEARSQEPASAPAAPGSRTAEAQQRSGPPASAATAAAPLMSVPAAPPITAASSDGAALVVRGLHKSFGGNPRGARAWT
jgi:peptidyl-prolyl cis-trans isomerase C